MALPKAINPDTCRTWTTDSGLTPECFTVCEAKVVKLLAEYVEQGSPLSVALELAGVSEATYRLWSADAGRGKAPFVWAITLLKKAQASYIYDQILSLNLAEGATYRKYLEILKLRNPAEWGGGGVDLSETEFDEEFL